MINLSKVLIEIFSRYKTFLQARQHDNYLSSDSISADSNSETSEEVQLNCVNEMNNENVCHEDLNNNLTFNIQESHTTDQQTQTDIR